MKVKNILKIFLFILILPSMINSSQRSKKQIPHAEWSRNLSIYEVNVRQFTKDGTFKAFIPHLNRLKEMNVGIL